MSKNTDLDIVRTEEYKQKYCQSTIQMEEGARTLYLLLGERLYNIRKERLYEPFWSSWEEYCMEYKDLSSASISKLMTVYEVFVAQYKFDPNELSKAGGWTKLYQMIKHIHSKKDADKWLHIAESQSRQDLDKTLTESATGVDMSTCMHKHTYLVRICEDCGEKHREYEDDEEEVKATKKKSKRK